MPLDPFSNALRFVIAMRPRFFAITPSRSSCWMATVVGQRKFATVNAVVRHEQPAGLGAPRSWSVRLQPQSSSLD